MIVLKGKSVFEGIAIGRMKVIRHTVVSIRKREITDPEGEIQKFYTAVNESSRELERLYQKTLNEVGKESAEIFSIHKLMTEDSDFADSVCDKIRTQKVCAEYAADETGYEFSQIFMRMEDAYMKVRAMDVLDVSARIVRCIMGVAEEGIELSEPMILAASDFTPSEIVRIDRSKILGFATTFGSDNSHTAILARTLSLPSVVNLKDAISSNYDGKIAIIDGFENSLTIDPDDETLIAYTKKKNSYEKERLALNRLKGTSDVSKDGRRINIYANIGSADEAGLALENDAKGIGLFRSEFLYLESSDYPTEEFQFQEYDRLVRNMQGKPVIIRTMDIGADKQADYFHLEKEKNPALGYRSIRILLDRPEILETQLRALYRASASGNLMIMIPMITSLKEIKFVHKIAAKVKEELKREGIAFNDQTPLGIMIETPAAAVIADLLAKEVDFFSIGTNDLVQYTLAVDRQNPNLEKTYDAHHTAVLRLIRYTVEAAHRNGIWVGVCGELARDLSLLPFFLKIGVDELSVSPPYVLQLRKKIQNTDTGTVSLEQYI